MKWRRLSALLILLIGPSVAMAGSPDLGPADRAALNGYAKDTWRSFDALALASGLPSDMLTKTADGWSTARYTSPSDIAAYLWSILAAEDLKIINREEAASRMSRTLAAVEKLERSHGFFFNWYDPLDGSTLKTWPGGSPVRPFLSTVDNAWLAASLMMVRNARPGFRSVADGLLAPMNFGFFYDPYDPKSPGTHPGLLRGGFYVDDNTFAGFHYGMLNTEARIASYVGISQGQLPLEHYYRMSRARPPDGDNRITSGRGEVREYHGVPVDEGFRSYRGLRVVPSWDGSMFEALMVSLFVPEAEWAPNGWGVNHPLYVRASIENATQDVRLPAWGASPSSIPGGGYRVYGVSALSADGRKVESTGDTVMTPHASFLALSFAPREAIDNMGVLAGRFKAYGPHGFLDAVDVSSGRIAECELALDQGMIMASIANFLSDSSLQKAFCEGKVAEVIRPLIAPERFGSGFEAKESRTSSSREVPTWPRATNPTTVAAKFCGTLLGAMSPGSNRKQKGPVRRTVGRSIGEFAWSD
jgi:hypothetical protein